MNQQLADAVYKAKQEGRQVFLCGNGGSAVNAMHIANDWASAGVRAHALTGNIALLTAIANDYGYDYVFSKQIGLFANAGDILVVLTGSGNSRNILYAIDKARSRCMTIWAITGGGIVMGAADNTVLTEPLMEHSEQAQLAEGHAIAIYIKTRANSV